MRQARGNWRDAGAGNNQIAQDYGISPSQHVKRAEIDRRLAAGEPKVLHFLDILSNSLKTNVGNASPARRARRLDLFRLGRGDSRNPFPKTPGPMLTIRLKPDGYSKVKTISRAPKIMSWRTENN